MSEALVRNWTVFWRSAHVDYAEFFALYTWRTWLFGWFGRVVAQVSFYALIGQLLGSAEQRTFLLIGNAVVIICVESMVIVHRAAEDRQSGALPLQLAAPYGYFASYLGRSVAAICTGFVSSVGALLLTYLMFDLPVPAGRVLLAPLLIAVVGVSTYCFALFLGSLVLRRPTVRFVVRDMGFNVLMAFCGVSVPIAFWPQPIPTLVQVLPLTHGLAAIRALLAGDGAAVILRGVAEEALVGAGWLVLAFVALSRLRAATRAANTADVPG